MESKNQLINKNRIYVHIRCICKDIHSQMSTRQQNHQHVTWERQRSDNAFQQDVTSKTHSWRELYLCGQSKIGYSRGGVHEKDCNQLSHTSNESAPDPVYSLCVCLFVGLFVCYNACRCLALWRQTAARRRSTWTTLGVGWGMLMLDRIILRSWWFICIYSMFDQKQSSGMERRQCFSGDNIDSIHWVTHRSHTTR